MTLVAFDFDGTLTQADLTVLLGREHDVAGEIRGLAEQGLRGEVDFATTLRQRASLLGGMPEARVDAAFERCKLRAGAADLISDLRRSGVSVAIISGSFERGIETTLEQAGITADYVVANRLVLENGAVTGDVDGPLLDGRKGDLLEELAFGEKLDLRQTVAVGNGATDLSMLQVAGTAIGFDPEPVVEDHCDVVVTSVRKLQLYFQQHDFIDTDT
ncbi:MAG: phosphoserine phosphatase SerB [Haloarculaceae archaeon]